MALDGITISHIVHELKAKILGGRVDKIYQPERDEIIMAIRSLGDNYKLLLTANSSNPRIHFTDVQKSNPIQAPMFCMILRKHLSGGRIIEIKQPNFERIIEIYVESTSELKDMSVKKLIIEIMGKHSNIIVVDSYGVILDSIKHVSHDKSSVREVLPNKKYVYPPAQNKINPLELEKNQFFDKFAEGENLILQKLIYTSYSGISPIAASEICELANVSSDSYIRELKEDDIKKVFNSFRDVVQMIASNEFESYVIFDESDKPIEFSSFDMTLFKSYRKLKFDTASEMLQFYYTEKDVIYRTLQKTSDLRKLIQNNIDRCLKKREMYNKTLNSLKERDMLKIKGEILTANIYSLEKGMTSFTGQNFYDESGSEITIALDANLNPAENAQRYFKKYNKEKRTYVALQDQIKQNDIEFNYLESVFTNLSVAVDETDIEEIRNELSEEGFVKKRKASKNKNNKKSKPIHYVSSDGFNIYVGKNNKQNDELTLKVANGNDIWFHTKDIPGSHVILKTEGQEASNISLNEAALLAAYFSKAKNSSSVPVDYVQRRNVKKPNGAKPGFVIYENHKTAYVTPDERVLKDMLAK